VREAVAFLLLACACGAAWSGGPSAGAKTGETDETDGLAAHPAGPAPDAGGGFAALEQRAGSLAPGMRMAAERENGGERVELVRAVEKDACVRAAFEASEPVSAKLVDAEGVTLAETAAPVESGSLGERGPVCIRKGDAISGVASGRVRWIAWALP
jgi:hypothetical protein